MHAPKTGSAASMHAPKVGQLQHLNRASMSCLGDKSIKSLETATTGKKMALGVKDPNQNRVHTNAASLKGTADKGKGEKQADGKGDKLKILKETEQKSTLNLTRKSSSAGVGRRNNTRKAQSLVDNFAGKSMMGQIGTKATTTTPSKNTKMIAESLPQETDEAKEVIELAGKMQDSFKIEDQELQDDEPTKPQVDEAASYGSNAIHSSDTDNIVLSEGHDLPPIQSTHSSSVSVDALPNTDAINVNDIARALALARYTPKSPPKIKLRPLLLSMKHRVSSSLSIPKTSSLSGSPVKEEPKPIDLDLVSKSDTPRDILSPTHLRRVSANTISSSSRLQQSAMHLSPPRPVIRYSPKDQRWINMRNPDKPVPASIIIGKAMIKVDDEDLNQHTSKEMQRTPTKSNGQIQLHRRERSTSALADVNKVSSMGSLTYPDREFHSARASTLKQTIINPSNPLITLSSPSLKPASVNIPLHLRDHIGKQSVGSNISNVAATGSPSKKSIPQDFAEFMQKAKIISESEMSENAELNEKKKRKRGKKAKVPLPPAEKEVLNLSLLKKKFEIVSPPDQVSLVIRIDYQYLDVPPPFYSLASTPLLYINY